MIIPTEMYGWQSERPYPSMYSLNYGIVSPITLGNLVAWYKASDFDSFTHGSEVLVWNNSGSSSVLGNLRLTPAGAAGNRPTVSRNSINTNMTSVANANTRGLASTSGTTFLTAKGTWTWFGVVKFTSRAAENNFMALQAGVNEIRLGITTNGIWTLVYANVIAGTNQAGPSLNDWHYIVVVDSSDTETLYMDGQAATPWLVTPTLPNANPTDIAIGEATSGTTKLTGNIAECGVFDRALAANELTLLFAYFQNRYGLA